MMFYDKDNNKLVVFGYKADSYYWDKHWQVDNFVAKVESGANNRFIKKYVTKFLRPGARILEGGCGIGQNVYGLTSWGYDAYGVDFAKGVIKRIKRNFPDLKVIVQDIRRLAFKDNFFDGYCCLGVIEHFIEGYDEILDEAKRVIKPEGYLFLSFPHISTLRRVKMKLKHYKILNNSCKIGNFYQFILDASKVEEKLSKYGFKLVGKSPFDAVKGMKDEISFLKPILQILYDSQNLFARSIKFLISMIFANVAGHGILLIFKLDEK